MIGASCVSTVSSQPVSVSFEIVCLLKISCVLDAIVGISPGLKNDSCFFELTNIVQLLLLLFCFIYSYRL